MALTIIAGSVAHSEVTPTMPTVNDFDDFGFPIISEQKGKVMKTGVSQSYI
jgi:hypothetical protein